MSKPQPQSRRRPLPAALRIFSLFFIGWAVFVAGRGAWDAAGRRAWGEVAAIAAAGVGFVLFGLFFRAMLSWTERAREAALARKDEDLR